MKGELLLGADFQEQSVVHIMNLGICRVVQVENSGSIYGFSLHICSIIYFSPWQIWITLKKVLHSFNYALKHLLQWERISQSWSATRLQINYVTASVQSQLVAGWTGLTLKCSAGFGLLARWSRGFYGLGHFRPLILTKQAGYSISF